MIWTLPITSLDFVVSVEEIPVGVPAGNYGTAGKLKRT